MGLLRTYLAACVVLWHLFAGQPLFGVVNGIVAVLFFYMISGFLMTMVINEKYQPAGPGWVRSFYLARLKRIYPLYLLVLVATLAIYPAVGLPSPFHASLSAPQWIFVILSNLGIVGLDFYRFLPAEFQQPGLPVIEIAWTLGIELQFYLVAPFIVAKPLRWCAAALLTLLALRIAILANVAPRLYWSYYFGPAVWCFFLMGAVGYKLAALIDNRHKPMLGLSGVVLLFAAAVAVDPGRVVDTVGMWTLYAVGALVLPYLFALSRHSRIDQAIGDLSYPLYLVHLAVVWPLTAAAGTGMLSLPVEHLKTIILVTVAAVTVTLCLVEAASRRPRLRPVVAHFSRA